MKIFLISMFALSLNCFAAVPTEEGLLKNLNNPNLPGQFVTLKAMIKKINEPGKPENNRVDYYKFVLATEGEMSLLQVSYNGSQMQNAQIQDVKYISNLNDAIKKEKMPERAMFYAVMSMLASNRPIGMISLVEKTGSAVTMNKQLLNEDKLKLLKTYRSYLQSTKGKGEATSPLNPQDPEEKNKVLDLFKANTYQRSQNISMVKEGNEYLWLVDWKTIRALFTNEERRLKILSYNQGEINYRIEASEYTSFNNNNEFPKYIVIKDENGDQYKVQFLSEDVKKSSDKKFTEQFEVAKKAMTKPIENSEIFGFLF